MSWRLDTSWLLHHLNYWALGLGDTRGESLQPPSSRCLFPYHTPLTLFLSLLISPGRFLAANMVNVLLARILITYDFKFEEIKGVPREYRITSFRPLGNTNILFRKRQNMRHCCPYPLTGRGQQDSRKLDLGIIVEKRP